MHFDLSALIQATGYIGLFVIIYVESGLLIGFFLPGDSLLFTAGFLASQGLLNLYAVMGLIFVAAVLGDSTGYGLGRRLGPRIFKGQRRIFNPEHLAQAESFYQRHGGKTIVLARFVPIVRTFAPMLAGISRMNYTSFLSYNILGGLIWAVSVPLLGFYLGKSIPNIDQYLLPVIGGVVLLSLVPSLIHLLKHPRESGRVLKRLILRPPK